GDAFELLCLDRVQFVVTPYQHQDGRASGLVVAFDDDRLDGAFGADLQEVGQFGNGLHAGGVNLLESGRGRGARRIRCERLGQFDVGRVIGLRTPGDVVFSGFGDDVEFV